MALVPSIGLLAPVESVEEFGRGISMQLDFTIEARNNRSFAENFKDDRDVIFPALIDELCSARVLTMEFIDGTKILNFRQTPSDPKRLAADRLPRDAEDGVRGRLRARRPAPRQHLHHARRPRRDPRPRPRRRARRDASRGLRALLRRVGAGRRQDDGGADGRAVAGAQDPRLRRLRGGGRGVRAEATTASGSARCRSRWCSWT